MDEVFEDLKEYLLQTMPVERRLEGLSAEEILSVISKEELLRRLSVDDILPALSRVELGPEERARLRELLERAVEGQ